MYRLLLIALLWTGCTYPDSRCPDYPLEHFTQLEDELTENWPGPYDLYLGSITEVQCINEKPESNGRVYNWGFARINDDLTTTIVIRKLPTLRMTAYVHELVHVGLWEVTGDPDTTHAEEDGPWGKEHDDVILKLWGI